MCRRPLIDGSKSSVKEAAVTDVKLDLLEAEVLEGLARRAYSHGRTVEDEAASIIREAVVTLPEPLGARLRARFAPYGGIALNIPDRPSSRTPPFVFDEDFET